MGNEYPLTQEMASALRDIKLLVLDVDGVLTRGEIIYTASGDELKIFNVKDGLGVYLLGCVDIPTVLLSAKDSPVLHRRARDMHVAEVIGGVLPKVRMLDYLIKKYSVSEKEICFIGDDLIDIGVIKRAGVGIAVADAVNAVKKSAMAVTSRRGGDGAVREVIDWIIEAKGLQRRIDTIVEERMVKGSVPEA